MHSVCIEERERRGDVALNLLQAYQVFACCNNPSVWRLRLISHERLVGLYETGRVPGRRPQERRSGEDPWIEMDLAWDEVYLKLVVVAFSDHIPPVGLAQVGMGRPKRGEGSMNGKGGHALLQGSLREKRSDVTRLESKACTGLAKLQNVFAVSSCVKEGTLASFKVLSITLHLLEFTLETKKNEASVQALTLVRRSKVHVRPWSHDSEYVIIEYQDMTHWLAGQ
jgi:hypothetical protein